MTKKTTDLGIKKKEKIGGKLTLLVLLSLIMPTIAGVIIGVKEITNQGTIYMIQFVAIAVGCLLALIWARLSSFTFKELGFRKFTVGKWLMGLLVIEGLASAGGMKNHIELTEWVWLVLFMLAVGVFEELIYRGLILNYIQKSSRKKAILLSAGLFGIGHLVNVLGGAALNLTVVQIVFAGLFGIVTAELVMLTGSILPVMVWHTCHNILSNLTNSSVTTELIVVGVQCLVLALMAVLLWRQLFSNNLIS
ncbi:CPBP family intramembrane metalloprotease [Vagococcus sp. BWB3-3]|uniref:CPBP family intramembrane metalloprotease n=1 Tax=Vagococcus allomyrinae TaxID=2794353 RepID=A0A940PDI4_9ENTE|nr:CPBP family intramembrane glutamic endopeptidase [Vagococcus allomyrinae]MBP1042587.1 CPBP family intramembrane metalloprotease [Vagococcus allomyrinae]